MVSRLDALDALADAGGEVVEEEVRQQGDILGAFAERRHCDGEDAETIVEVLAKGLLADGLDQVAIGGGDDPDVDCDRRAAADARRIALLEDAEQLGLGLRGQLADLVEEERAPLGQLEAADPAGDGAGERALLVAEELALDEPRGESGAVDLDQRLGRRRLFEWIARAISSLPVPVSPVMSTVASVAATRLTLSSTATARAIVR